MSQSGMVEGIIRHAQGYNSGLNTFTI